MKNFRELLGKLIDAAYPFAILYLVIDGWWLTGDMTTWEGAVLLLLLGLQRR